MARPRKTEVETPKAAGYTPPEGWENSVIVEIEKRNFNQATGDKMSSPIVQTFEPRFEWPALVLNLNGWTINEVKYMPEGTKTMDEIIKAEKERQDKRFNKRR